MKKILLILMSVTVLTSCSFLKRIFSGGNYNSIEYSKCKMDSPEGGKCLEDLIAKNVRLDGIYKEEGKIDRAFLQQLDWVARYAKPEFQKVVAEKLIDPNFEDPYGNTPLLWLTNGFSENREGMINLLIANGADPNKQNMFGISAIEYAIASYDLQSFKVMEAAMKYQPTDSHREMVSVLGMQLAQGKFDQYASLKESVDAFQKYYFVKYSNIMFNFADPSEMEKFQAIEARIKHIKNHPDLSTDVWMKAERKLKGN